METPPRAPLSVGKTAERCKGRDPCATVQPATVRPNERYPTRSSADAVGDLRISPCYTDRRLANRGKRAAGSVFLSSSFDKAYVAYMAAPVFRPYRVADKVRIS
jgi:hypothetical protein